MYMSPDEFPLPYEYRGFTFDGLVGAPPDDIDERVVVFLDCGNIDRMPVDFLQRDGAPHPQHRPPPRQHPLRHGEPRVAGGLVHRRDRVGGWPRSSAPRSRPRSPTPSTSGLVTDTGRSCTRTPRRRPPDGRGADRGRGRRRTGLPAPLRGPAVPPPAAARARAAQRRALRRRRDHARPPHAGGLRGDRRARDRLRGHRRPPARGGGHRRSPCWCASCSATTATGSARSACAPPTAGGRVDHRPRAGRRRPPPGRRLLDRAAAGRAGGALRAQVAAQLAPV